MSRVDDLIARLCPNGVPVAALGDVGEFIRGNGLQKSDLADEGAPAIHYGQIHTHYGMDRHNKVVHQSSLGGQVAPRQAWRSAAARALLAVEEREAKLLGLDVDSAPVVTSGHLDREIDRLTQEIGKLDAPPVRDPWEDWTPADRVADDVHRDGEHHPGAEVVRLPRRGDQR